VHRQKSVANAEASLAQAEANLAQLLEPATAEDIANAEEKLHQAELAYLDAKEALANATLTAPFAGTVTAVNTAIGEYASGNVVEIISQDFQVTLEVDEIDISQVALDQAVYLTTETWPDTTFSGDVTAIAPQSTGNGAVVTFEVTVTLTEVDLPIRVGMTVNAELTTAELSEVLLVPNEAITTDRSTGISTVERIISAENGQMVTETVEVSIGFKNQTFTEIRDGLTIGDDVILGSISAPVTQTGFGPGR
jgi:RND family efflux transporter MFP subunit